MPGLSAWRQATARGGSGIFLRATPSGPRATPCPLDCFAAGRAKPSPGGPGAEGAPRSHGRVRPSRLVWRRPVLPGSRAARPGPRHEGHEEACEARAAADRLDLAVRVAR